MLARVMKRASILKAPVTPCLLAREPRKISKTLLSLAASPSAAVQKAKKKALVNKFSPSGRLVLKRPVEYLVKLDVHCWGPRSATRTAPTSQHKQCKVLKTVGETRVSKKTSSRKQKKEKQERLLNQAERVLSMEQGSWVDGHISGQTIDAEMTGFEPALAMATSVSPETISPTANSTPRRVDPLAPSSIFKGRGGRLRGPDSCFARADFDATIPTTYAEGTEGAVQAPRVWAADTPAGIFQAQISSYRRGRAVEFARQQEDKSGVWKAPSQREVGGTANLDDSSSSSIRTTTRPAMPVFGFQHALRAVTNQDSEMHETGVTDNTPASVVIHEAQTARAPGNGVSFGAAVLPLPHSSRGCQRRVVTASAAVSVSQNQGDVFGAAALPLPSSARGCQRKVAGSSMADDQQQATDQAQKAVTTPRGARRAMPIRLVVGEADSGHVGMLPIDSGMQRPPRTPAAGRVDESNEPQHMNDVDCDVINTSIDMPPLRPPSHTASEPTRQGQCALTYASAVLHSDTDTAPLFFRHRSQNNFEDIKEEGNHLELKAAVGAPVVWQPKSWSRKDVKLENYRTWKKQSCPIELQQNPDRTDQIGDGEYDHDLIKMKDILGGIDDKDMNASVIKSIMLSAITSCMGQEAIVEDNRIPQHVSSIPKLAGVAPGSTVSHFKHVSAPNASQAKLDEFEDDLIKLQIQSPDTWEWLVGNIVQAGCSLNDLLVTRTVSREGSTETVTDEDTDIFDEVLGRGSSWAINWRQVDDHGAELRGRAQREAEKYYDTTDLVGMSRHDLDTILRMIRLEGYFDAFADQLKQWAICNTNKFSKVIRKAGLCEEHELEDLCTVKQWLSSVAVDQHENFEANIERCLRFRYPHWYERFGED